MAQQHPYPGAQVVEQLRAGRSAPSGPLAKHRRCLGLTGKDFRIALCIEDGAAFPEQDVQGSTRL